MNEHCDEKSNVLDDENHTRLNKEIVAVGIAGKALVLQRQSRQICVFTQLF